MKTFTLKQASIMSITAIMLVACDNPSNRAQPSGQKDTPAISVSGLSSGAYMAMQFHLSFSEKVIGSGLIAGGPYYCAQGSISTALQNCVANPDSMIDLSALSATINDYQQSGKLADSKYNQNDKVWLLHGTLDTRINTVVADQLAAQTRTIFGPDNIKYVNDQAFSHIMPTLGSGDTCTLSASPFIGNCNYDAAGELLKYITQLSQPKSAKSNDELSQQLLTFKQSEYAGEHAATLGENAFVFVPESCKKSMNCDVHISFHGCNQNAEAVENEYAKNAGFNAWADTNNLIVLYPQTKKSAFMPLNPQACWDWWGYTGADYANKDGEQIKAVMALVEEIPTIIAQLK
ncbi:MAG: poly(3-hydroxybutyrate) depolymerase [Gammaproteobacteria bacterium]|jgi:poly(3-hydroxybutyrate) depolymerase